MARPGKRQLVTTVDEELAKVVEALAVREGLNISIILRRAVMRDLDCDSKGRPLQ